MKLILFPINDAREKEKRQKEQEKMVFTVFLSYRVVLH